MGKPIAEMSADGTLTQEMAENMEYLVRVLDDRKNIVYMNKSMRKQFGDMKGKPCHQIFFRDSKCDDCVTSRSWESGKPEVKDILSGSRYFRLMSSPIMLDADEKYSVEMLYDITEQKSLEVELMEHYGKLTAELNFARNIQRSMLPADGVYWDTFRLSSLYLPAEVLGGDLFDIIRISENQTLLYIADVSGHGVQASMLTMFLREVVRGKLKEAAESMKSLMKSLMDGYEDLDIDPEIYLSVLLCCYDKAKQELSIVNAGHNCYPLIVRNDGAVEEIIAKGLPISKLGSFFDYNEIKTGFVPGERLVLYTDGIVEEFNKEEQKVFGAEGVKEILKEYKALGGKDLAARIVGAAMDFSDDHPKDDRAIMVADAI
ncbi:MAG: SpoIIE family protein phosphatase [Clostridiales Family XIII bacterium]|nr:SpoIIE family protein phosphatase [Clostridiales Family XIII bacterium]